MYGSITCMSLGKCSGHFSVLWNGLHVGGSTSAYPPRSLLVAYSCISTDAVIIIDILTSIMLFTLLIAV